MTEKSWTGGCPRGEGFVGIRAGTLDPPSGLRCDVHVRLSQAGDRGVVADDLPRTDWSSGGRSGA